MNYPKGHVSINTLRPRQNCRHFPDDIFKRIFLNKNVWISINISLEFYPRGPINNIPTLVQVMAWRRPGDKPLSEPMMVRFPTHICVTRPQWVNQIMFLSNILIHLFFIPLIELVLHFHVEPFGKPIIQGETISHRFTSKAITSAEVISSCPGHINSSDIELFAIMMMPVQIIFQNLRITRADRRLHSRFTTWLIAVTKEFRWFC